ncbi:hypothetical protein BDW74DRAFT_188548 [Aspergillus multicolor]|uniref:uncharacterized protein n=1 Tax=Aspergillus multicolor TaxID=41759 RepID=UPI003CCD2039
MRHASSCTQCRSRKKRCIALRLGQSCTSCSQKRWKCDLAGPSRPTSINSTQNGRPLPRAARRAERTMAPAGPKTASDVQQSDAALPPDSVCNELIDLYFDLIDEKQLLPFHRATFIAAQRAGQIPHFIVLAMIALMACFSEHSYFESIHPWHRARPWFKSALQAFNARSELIDLASLQASILLSIVALAEGSSAQKALLTSQAICMVRMLRLPENLNPDPIRREVEIRIFWGMWMMENWHAARVVIPKQLVTKLTFKSLLEGEAFRNMRPADPAEQYAETRINALGLRSSGLWTWMIPLSKFYNQVMQLNDELVENTISDNEIHQRVSEISDDIDTYLRDLPSHIQHTPENRERYSGRGLGREFTILQLNYHHQCQMLFYQFLNKKQGDSEERIDHEAAMYDDRCKAHAAALGEVTWNTNSRSVSQCLWSPVNGHLLVVSSSVLNYTLMFDADEASITKATKLLEQNFIMLLQLWKHWSLRNSTEANFDMDRWMIYFLNRHDANVSERYDDGVHGSSSTVPNPDLDLTTDSWLKTVRQDHHYCC